MTQRVDTDLLLEDMCCGCGASPAALDSIGLYWCAACDHRRALLAWGAHNDWPALSGRMLADEGYEQDWWDVALSEGQWYWVNAATLGKDEYVYALLLAADAYDKQQVAEIGGTNDAKANQPVGK